VEWEIEFTDEFGAWWDSLTADEQDSVRDIVDLLRRFGPGLGRPHADSVYGSRFNLKELRIQHAGRPYRILFAFDPRRVGLLLIGGDKTGNARWYEQTIPLAEKIYEQHLLGIGKEKKGG
jgi:hypothetical protein